MKWEEWIVKARHRISLCGVLLNDDELLRDYFNNGYSPEYAAAEFVAEINMGKARP